MKRTEMSPPAQDRRAPHDAPDPFGLDADEMQRRLDVVASLVAQPMPKTDPAPAEVGEATYVGNMYHARDVPNLVRLGITAVLNCASSGIRNLPIDDFAANGIEYHFTNVAQDADTYPILHDRSGVASSHLEKAKAVYDKVRSAGGRILFFCVAGQNRSATLAIAVLVACRRVMLREVLAVCARTRPFILENVGFQRQLIELETRTADLVAPWKRRRPEPSITVGGLEVLVELSVPGVRTFDLVLPCECTPAFAKASALKLLDAHLMSCQRWSTSGKAWLLFSSFCSGPERSLILEPEAVELSVQLLRLQGTFGLALIGDAENEDCRVRWNPSCRFELILFSTRRDGGCHEPFTFRHEERPNAPDTLLAVEIDPYIRACVAHASTSIEPLRRATRSGSPPIWPLRWTHTIPYTGVPPPFDDRRRGAFTGPPLLVHRWDLVTGEVYRSSRPNVFSFSSNPRNKRDFMAISTSCEGEVQQFNAPGEGGILGMGANAIVHHAVLEAVTPPADSPAPLPRSLRRQVPMRRAACGVGHVHVALGMGAWRSACAMRHVACARGAATHVHAPCSTCMRTPPHPVLQRQSKLQSGEALVQRTWDAAVKRQFKLDAMLAALENKSEAGVAKRLRMAGALNGHGRLLYFYGLGICLAANNDDHSEFRFEATILSQFQQDFSSYTLKSFMDDYTAVPACAPSDERARIESMQANFCLIKVKVLLCSLLNGFRDLTLMGVVAFDFNHLNNVLISRDYRNARLIDIDGASKGSISAEQLAARPSSDDNELHRPALDIDLSTMLPLVVQQLLLGKGHGKPFVDEQVSRVRRAPTEQAAKAVLRSVLIDNFFPELAEMPEIRAANPTGLTRPPSFIHSSFTTKAEYDAWIASGGVVRINAKVKHLSKVVEWFYATLLRRTPWNTWTNDIYDAMRCIDHLPVG